MDKKNGEKQIKNSFKLMNINKCQLVQIHNLLDWKSHLYTLEKLKEEGLIDYIGITHFHSGAYDDLIKIIKMKKFDFVQFNHSIVERQAEKNSFVSQMIITTQLLLIGLLLVAHFLEE